MKIVIISNFFAPQKTPRAHRTEELVKEFVNRGYTVHLVIPHINIPNKYYDFQNLTIDFFTDKQPVFSEQLKIRPKSDGRLKRLIKRGFKYFFPIPLGDIKRCIKLQRYLKMNIKSYDCLISISNPIYINIATAWFLKSISKSGISIGEYSDPFCNNPAHKMLPIYKLVDVFIGKWFDYISIPIKNAIDCYSANINRNKIRIIPLGVNQYDYEIKEYKRNEIPTFVYAGMFYEDIRNPQVFFDFLVDLSSQMDFRFVIYFDMETANSFTKQIISNLKEKLKDNLVLPIAVDRNKLIKELSTYDFLINVNNLGGVQSPSKLIDYGLANRPVFSFSQEHFDSKCFGRFLDGDFKEEDKINLSKHSIAAVADSFVELIS